MTVYYKPYLLKKLQELRRNALAEMQEIDRVELSEQEIRQLNYELLITSNAYVVPLFTSEKKEVQIWGIKVTRG